MIWIILSIPMNIVIVLDWKNPLNIEVFDHTKFKNSYEKAKLKTQDEIPMSPSKHSKLIYFKKMFSNKLSLNEIIKIENIYWKEFAKNAKLQEKAIKRLKIEKNKENVYILFSNQNLDIQLRKISAWGIDIFDEIIASEEAGFEKPNMEFFNFVSPVVKNIRIKDMIYSL